MYKAANVPELFKKERRPPWKRACVAVYAIEKAGHKASCLKCSLSLYVARGLAI